MTDLERRVQILEIFGEASRLGKPEYLISFSVAKSVAKHSPYGTIDLPHYYRCGRCSSTSRTHKCIK